MFSTICLTGCSAQSGVTGWELAVTFPAGGDVMPLSWTLRGDGMNFGVPPEFWVGMVEPLPWVEVMCLMDIGTLATWGWVKALFR